MGQNTSKSRQANHHTTAKQRRAKRSILSSTTMATAANAAPGAAQTAMWRDIVTSFFRPQPGRDLKAITNQYWSDDAVFKTPMFTVSGKNNVYHLLHFWQNVFNDHLDILDVAQQGDKVMVRIIHNLTLRPLSIARHLLPDIAWRLLNFPLIISATLDVDHGTGRGPRITGWYEDVSVYTLIYNLMPVNKMLPSVKLHDYVELALGKAIAIADEVGRRAYHTLAPTLLPLLDNGLHTADGMSKQYLGYNPRLYENSRSLWE